MRDKAYLGWVAKLPCISCAVRGVRRYEVHVAHCKIGYPEAGWRAFGHSEKSHDARVTPLCPSCHQTGPNAQHRNVGGDERAWWEALNIYPPDFCAALVTAYERKESGDRVVENFARVARSACKPPGSMP